MSDVRVRFAPSPTGSLHIGGVRTAMYAWLWAKKHGGTFILRIEDTDAERNTEESVQVVLESMKWLGLDWDEGPGVEGPHGPYFQSQRLETYRTWANKLIESGHAYRCYASREEIGAARTAYEEAKGKKGFRFQSPWRDRTDGDPDAPHVVRFKAPRDGKTGWADLVYGDVAYPNREQQDFVLIRENGLPLYNVGCFVDDLTMKVTLVTRGDDHLVNTPQQILLYRAAGQEPPQFAHLPMVLGPDGKKYSKRHGAVGVMDFAAEGYVPDGLLNYLARVGWSHGDQELFTRDELIAAFDWDHVGKTSARVDFKKMAHVQGHHLRLKTDAELATLVVPFLKKRGVEVAADDALLHAAIAPVKLRAATLDELAEGLDYFFREDDALEIEEKGAKKFLTPEFAPNLTKLADIVEAADPFDEATLEAAVVAWTEAAELKMKNVAQPARMALTGRPRSPGPSDTIVFLAPARPPPRLRGRGNLRARRRRGRRGRGVRRPPSADPRSGRPPLGDGAGPERHAAPAVHHGGRALAAAGGRRRRRSALSGPAVRL